jgi:hypothetical protein
VAGFNSLLIGQKGVKIMPEKTKNMKVVELAMVSIASLLFATMSLLVHMADRLSNLLELFGGLRVAEFFMYLIFLYLLGLLWISYRSWKLESEKNAELAEKHGKLADLVSRITPALSPEATYGNT